MKKELKKGELREMRKEMRKEVKREGKELKNRKDFLVEEDGMGTVEIILIIVVLVGLVLIFKEQITNIVNSIFNKITTQTGKV